MLEDAGYQVVEACDAREALEMLAAHPEISIVITDVQMPGSMDGLALVDIINVEYPAITTIVTSGRSGLPEARQCGASFLPKPYSANSIQAAIKAALAGGPRAADASA